MNFIVHTTEQNFSYEEALLILKEAADADRGIVWIKDENKGRITRFDLSSAQNEEPKPLFSSHDYLLQVMNMFRGADEIVAAIVDAPEKERLRSQLTRRALIVLISGFPRHNEKACKGFLKNFNSEVCTILKERVLPSLSLEEISRLLRKAESYAPLGERQHYSVETITKIGDSLVSQSDTLITGTTEHQKQLLENYSTQSWYQLLHPVEQALFRRHVDALTDGKHIPSAYLREIPGLRNCYRKVLAKLTLDDSGNITNKTVLASYTHSAAVAGTQGNRTERLQLANENYQQLCNANPGKNVNVLTLCSRVPCQGLIDRFFPRASSSALDTYVVDTTRSAVGRENTHIIPVNALRFISRNTIRSTCDKAIAAYVEKSGISTNPEQQALLKYLTQNTSRWNTRGYRQACANLLNLQTQEERALAKEMVELRRLEIKQSGLLGRLTSLFEVLASKLRGTPRNRNARLAAKVTALWEQVCDNDVLCVSCKSGKDRTGYTSMVADAIACAAYIPKSQPEAIQKALTGSGHVQFLASHSGGKTGCFGLKPVQVDAFEGIGGEHCVSLFTNAARSSSSISLANTDGKSVPTKAPQCQSTRTRRESTASSSSSLSTLSSSIGSSHQERHPVTDLAGPTVQRGIDPKQQTEQSASR
ncbi:hypothetical protein [Neorickettsia sennetsu]|nr:hypothetical protein [Neorickettsia sennetsu]